MKKANNKKNCGTLIEEMKKLLKKPTLTMESMIFSDVNEDDLEHDDDVPEMRDEEPDYDGHGPANDDITEIINKIRQLSLQAIAALADDPTSPQYQLLKKVWNLVDKSFESEKKPTHDEE